ncbi:hypothetical protein ACO2I3_06360 [Leptospira interrogans]
MDALTTQRVQTVTREGDLLRSKIAWKHAVLRQSLTYRLVDLGDAAISQWELGNGLASIVLGRAFLETVALVFFVAKRTEKMLAARDLDGLNQLAMQVTFGGRSPDWEFPDGPAINVMTALDHMSKEVEGTRKHYESISEIAHPNSQGTQQFYARINHDTGDVTLSNEKRGLSVIRPLLPAIGAGMLAAKKLAQIDDMVVQIADLQGLA